MHIKHMHEMIEDLAEYGKCMIEAGTGNGNVNLCETGQIVDMIKDLADAEYHSLISKEMKEAEEEDEAEEKYMMRMLKEEHKDEYKRMREEYGEEDGERRFYDNYRHANGRFARKGTGMYEPRRSGRRHYEEPPYYHMIPEMNHDPEWYRDMDRMDGRMYYTETGARGTGMRQSGTMRDSSGQSRTDRDYREGRSGQTRRSYIETKELNRDNTPESKQHRMKELEKYMGELSGDITEMIADASPEERSLLKQKLQVLTQKIG